MVAEGAVVRSVSDLLRDNADRYGERPAFADDRRVVSWAGLERRTAVIAAGLGVGRAARVAFLLDNGVALNFLSSVGDQQFDPTPCSSS